MNAALTHEQAAPRLDTATKLAFERTYVAHERTQMAWVRTALSLISFGFGITKFFEYLRENQAEHAPLIGPRTVGVVMICIGVAALALADVQHRHALKTLREQCPGLPASLAGVMGWLIALLGILALVSDFLRQ